MFEREEMNADDRELVDALKNLQPAAVGISSREIVFQAGVETARRQTNRWRVAALAMTVIAALAIGWARRASRTVDHFVYVRTEVPLPSNATSAATVAADPSSRSQYLKLCDDAMESESQKEIPAASATQPAEFDAPRRESREYPADFEFFINDRLRD